MVLTQIMEQGAENEGCARDLLKAEYKLLCKGDFIKVHFDKWAAERKISVPSKQYVDFCLPCTYVSYYRVLFQFPKLDLGMSWKSKGIGFTSSSLQGLHCNPPSTMR